MRQVSTWIPIATIVWMTVIVTALIFPSNACAKDPPPQDKTIVFATGEYPPFVSEKMKDQGLTAGLLRAALKKAGYSVRFDFYPWPRIEYLARDGKIISTMPWGKTTDREQYFTFSQQPIIISRRAVFYRKSRFSNLIFNSVQDLKSLRLAAIQSYWYIPEFKKHQIRYIEVNTAKKAWALLANNRVDGLVENYQVGLHDMNQYAPDLKKDLGSSKDPSSLPQFVAYSKSNPEALPTKKIIDTALTEFLKEQTLEEYYESQAP